MRVPFEKDNPFILISTCFLSNSYTLASTYRETSSCTCSLQSCSFLVLSSFYSSNRKTIRQLINTNEQTCICVCVIICIFIRTYAYMYTYIRAYLYAHTHILIHTYGYTYTHIRVYLFAYCKCQVCNYFNFHNGQNLRGSTVVHM